MPSERKKSDAEILLEQIGHYQLLGKISATWAVFELNTDKLIWEIAGIPQTVGACFTAQLIGPAKRFDVLICLVRLFNGSDVLLDEIKSLQGRASQIGEERNRRLHDAWFVNHVTGVAARFQITAKKELKFGLVEETTTLLEALISKIDKLSYEVHDLGKKIKAEIGASLGKPPQWPVSLAGSNQ
jgi:hypothetical protein